MRSQDYGYVKTDEATGSRRLLNDIVAERRTPPSRSSPHGTENSAGFIHSGRSWYAWIGREEDLLRQRANPIPADFGPWLTDANGVSARRWAWLFCPSGVFAMLMRSHGRIIFATNTAFGNRWRLVRPVSRKPAVNWWWRWWWCCCSRSTLTPRCLPFRMQKRSVADVRCSASSRAATTILAIISLRCKEIPLAPRRVHKATSSLLCHIKDA